jgi:hypothetical protein
MFTRTLHWFLSWARLIQPIPPHPISLGSILTLSSHPHESLPSGLHHGFPIKILYAFLFKSCNQHCSSDIFKSRSQMTKVPTAQAFNPAFFNKECWKHVQISRGQLINDVAHLLQEFSYQSQKQTSWL